MSHEVFFAFPPTKSKHWEWKYMLRMWERWKGSGLEIMSIWIGKVQGKDLEKEKQLDFTQETVMCSGSHSLFETTRCAFIMHYILLRGRMYSLVSDRPGFETWLLWLWTDNFLLSALLFSSLQQKTISISIEKIKWGNLCSNLKWQLWRFFFFFLVRRQHKYIRL